MKKNLVIFLLVVLTIINVAALVTIAYKRWHPKRHFPPMGQPDIHMNFIKQELGLNEDQVKEFESQDKRFKEETKPIHDSLRIKRKDLMEEMAVEEPDMEKLDELAEEIGTLEITLKKKLISHFLRGKSFLTPEQQRKFLSLFEERRDRIRDLMESRGGRRKPPRPPDLKQGE